MSKLAPSSDAKEAERNEIKHLIEQLQKKLRLLEPNMRSERELSPPDSKLRNDSSDYKGEADTLREVISDLKQKMKELVDKNLQWQEFHQHQEKKVKELQDLVHNLTSELTTLKRNISEDDHVTTELNFKSDREVEFENVIQQQKNEIDILKTHNTKLYEKCEDYKLQLQQSRSETRQLQDRIAEQIIDIPSERELALLEEMDVLKMQLVAHQEDFESERSDRERAQQQVEELKQYLKQSARPHDSFYKQPEYTVTTPHWNTKDTYGYSASEPVHITTVGYEDRQHRNTPASYHVYQTDCYDEVDGETAEELKLSVQENPATDQKPANSPVCADEEMNLNCPSDKELFLKCPKCQQEFDHLQLMAHFDNSDCTNT